MSVTTPIFRPGFCAKLGAGVDDGATEAGGVDGATDGAETDGATVGGTGVALPEQAETIRAIPASMPKPLVRMRIVPPQTRDAVRVRYGRLPMDRDEPPVQPHPNGAAAGGILATVLGTGKRLSVNAGPAPPAALSYHRSMPSRTPVILDCDPGHDDALAITLALARPELDLLAVTTVAGNAPLEATTRNALRVLTLLGRTAIPVAAGAARPLVRPLHVAVNVHGTSGLDGADLPEPGVAARPEHAVELMRALIEASPDPVTLIPTGPLTNIALLIRTYPRLLERVSRICLMGGAVGEGNATASAEFNIWADPDAAAIVFEAGRPLTMIGLDVTHLALVSAADAARMAALGTRTGRVFADLLEFFGRFHRERYGWDGSPIHDAVAVAHVALPGLVRTETCRVDIETTSELTRGRTVADRAGLTGRDPNAEIGLGIDRGRFVDLLVEAVAAFA